MSDINGISHFTASVIQFSAVRLSKHTSEKQVRLWIECFELISNVWLMSCDMHTGAHRQLISGEEAVANDYAPGHCTVSTETSRPGAGQDLQAGESLQSSRSRLILEPVVIYYPHQENDHSPIVPFTCTPPEDSKSAFDSIVPQRSCFIFLVLVKYSGFERLEGVVVHDVEQVVH